MDNPKVLRELPLDSIVQNPENPRIVFRQDEMDNLLVSIQKIGVQVPISVYKDGNKFVLIDGERRLRTCKKLNFKFIPSIIQEKPNSLDNLLLMFNIHALREQWDYLTIANKIPRIKELFLNKRGHEPTETELSLETGLTRGTIRRCNLLIELPDRFKSIILSELHKPKSKQTFTADFFLEMEQALKTVKNNFPEFENKMDLIRDNLIDKYKKKVLTNITDFRMLRKLATSANNVNFPKESAKIALSNIFESSFTNIEEVYNETVAGLYNEKKYISNAINLLDYISRLNEDDIKDDEELYSTLRRIRDQLDQLIGEVE